MSELVDPTEIERIVGARRNLTQHLGRAVTSDQRVYVLHSQHCIDDRDDLRACEFSQALDRGITRPYIVTFWTNLLDQPVILDTYWTGHLIAIEITENHRDAFNITLITNPASTALAAEEGPGHDDAD